MAPDQSSRRQPDQVKRLERNIDHCDRWHTFGTSSSSARGRSSTRREFDSNDIGTQDSRTSGQPTDPCAVGTKEDCLGKEAHRQDLLPTLCEDMGYLEWSRARYLSLPPPQQDFVDYCCAQLENDALMARQNVRNNQF